MIIIFIGPPGSGKGTQAELAANKMSLLHLSTGDLLRLKLSAGDKESEDLKKLMASGKLVPSEVVNNLVKDAISAASKSCILDGYPRNIAQAKFINENFSDDIKVIYFDVDREILVKRITGRLDCSNCGKIFNSNSEHSKFDNVCDKCGSHNFTRREDDNEETVKVRLEEYDKETSPLIDYYKTLGKLKIIDASGSVNQIYKELESIISLER